MGFYNGPKLITDGLVLALDAADKNSYPGSGTTWYDLMGNYDFTLVNSPTYTTHNGTSVFNFDGTDDYITRAGSVSHDIASTCTLTLVISSISNTDFGYCSRLFSVSNGAGSNNDFNTYFTLASCNQSKYGLWYKNSPGGLYPSQNLKTANDDFKVVTYKWTTSSTAYVFVNGNQEASAGITSAFNYTNIARMTIGMNSCFCTSEQAYVRVASVHMYNRELSSEEVQQNYYAFKTRFSL